MSRGFGSTFGANSSSDLIYPKYSAVPASQYSISFWCFINGSGQSGFGNVMGQQNSSNVKNWAAYMNNTPTQMGFGINWTGTGANFLWTVQAHSWQQIVIVYDTVGSPNLASIYVNGVAQVLSASSTSGVPDNAVSQINIGHSNTGGNTWDGMLAHMAYWNGTLLSSGDALALGSGVNPIIIRPEALTFYLPLDGVNSPEPDLILGTSSTITGTRLGISDPPVQYISEVPIVGASIKVPILPNGAYARGLMYNGGGTFPQYAYSYTGGAGIIDWSIPVSSASSFVGGAALHRIKRGQAGTVMRGRLGTGGAH